MLRRSQFNSYGVNINRYFNDSSWYKYIQLAQKKKELKEVLSWFDTRVLNDIFFGASVTTVDVRVRIVCGMVNKLTCITPDMKYELMNLMYEKRKEYQKKHIEFLARYVYNIPF